MRAPVSGFEEVEDLFALAEGVHQRRAAGAHVLQEEADEAGVVLQAGEFAGDDAEVFGALGDLDAGELFDGEGVGPVVGDASRSSRAGRCRAWSRGRSRSRRSSRGCGAGSRRRA